MTECDELARREPDTVLRNIYCFDDAVKIIRQRMPEETMTIIDNTAWSLYMRALNYRSKHFHGPAEAKNG